VVEGACAASKEGESMLKVFDLNTCPTTPMENGRGDTIRLINTGAETEKIDLHFNRLVPGGRRGRMHRHSQSDNVYIVRRGEGTLTVAGASYTIPGRSDRFHPGRHAPFAEQPVR
jgi:oxalate decarboxylase/phosphoglucose isomerase-like protein (cupin superfamily)